MIIIRILQKMLTKTQTFSNQKKRRWQKVIEPLLKYNRKVSSFGCPIDFYYEVQKMVKQGYTLNFNIPHTLTGAHDNYLCTVFQASEDKIGKINFTTNLNKSKFGIVVDQISRKSLAYLDTKKDTGGNFSKQLQDPNNSKSYCLPFVVIRQKNQTQSSTCIWNIHEYNKSTNIDANQIAQSYVFSRNPFISIIRFFYSPHSNHKNSSAYNIENIQKISSRKMNKSQWKVIETLESSCSYVKIMHENKCFYKQTINVVECLEKSINKTIKRLVTDWIVDIYGKYYLIDVKQVQFTDRATIHKCNKRSVSQLLSVVTCSMCLQSFHSSEITKVLTNKLIQKFDNHLKKRQINLSFKVNYKKIIDISKVCNLCYSLVVKQHELMELQKIMGEICNLNIQKKKIQYTSHQQSNSLSIIHDRKHHPALMNRWRFLIYIEDLKNCGFISKFYNQNNKQLYLHLKICNSVSTFVLKPKSTSIQIRAIKLFHLFSKEEEIFDFFCKTEILVEMSTSLKWGKPIAEGCIQSIYHQQQIRTRAFYQRKYKEVLLFTNNTQYLVLGLYIGLTLDGIKKTDKLNLEQVHDVYKCADQYLDCTQFPPEWMEIIDPTYVKKTPKVQNIIHEHQFFQNVVKKIFKEQHFRFSHQTNITTNSEIVPEQSDHPSGMNATCGKSLNSSLKKNQIRHKSKSTFPDIKSTIKPSRKKLVL